MNKKLFSNLIIFNLLFCASFVFASDSNPIANNPTSQNNITITQNGRKIKLNIVKGELTEKEREILAFEKSKYKQILPRYEQIIITETINEITKNSKSLEKSKNKIKQSKRFAVNAIVSLSDSFKRINNNITVFNAFKNKFYEVKKFLNPFIKSLKPVEKAVRMQHKRVGYTFISLNSVNWQDIQKPLQTLENQISEKELEFQLYNWHRSASNIIGEETVNPAVKNFIDDITERNGQVPKTITIIEKPNDYPEFKATIKKKNKKPIIVSGEVYPTTEGNNISVSMENERSKVKVFRYSYTAEDERERIYNHFDREKSNLRTTIIRDRKVTDIRTNSPSPLAGEGRVRGIWKKERSQTKSTIFMRGGYGLQLLGEMAWPLDLVFIDAPTAIIGSIGGIFSDTLWKVAKETIRNNALIKLFRTHDFYKKDYYDIHNVSEWVGGGPEGMLASMILEWGPILGGVRLPKLLKWMKQKRLLYKYNKLVNNVKGKSSGKVEEIFVDRLHFIFFERLKKLTSLQRDRVLSNLNMGVERNTLLFIAHYLRLNNSIKKLNAEFKLKIKPITLNEIKNLEIKVLKPPKYDKPLDFYTDDVYELALHYVRVIESSNFKMGKVLYIESLINFCFGLSRVSSLRARLKELSLKFNWDVEKFNKIANRETDRIIDTIAKKSLNASELKKHWETYHLPILKGEGLTKKQFPYHPRKFLYEYYLRKILSSPGTKENKLKAIKLIGYSGIHNSHEYNLILLIWQTEALMTNINKIAPKYFKKYVEIIFSNATKE